MSEWRHGTRHFLGQGSFCGTRGHFDKHFVKNTRRKVPQGNVLEFFLDTIKTTFGMENFIQRWT